MDTARNQPDVAVGTPQAEPPVPANAAKVRQGRLAGRQLAPRFAILVVWAAMIAVYWGTEPLLFPRTGTFQTIFGSQQPLVFMTMALMCTIIVGEFVDLSVPAVFGFGATILPVLVVNHGWNVWPAAIAAVLGCVVVGAINGFLVVKVGVNTIVVTLGMSTLVEGISLWMSDLNTISGMPSGFQKIALFDIGGLPVSFYYGVILVLGFAYLLAFTPLGRHMRFVGASREVSRLSGVRVDRIRFGSFVFASLLSGIGAVIAVAAIGG
jgi:ribose transport system permease protein